VLDAITAPLPREPGSHGSRSAASSVPASATSEFASPTAGPPCLLDTLVAVLGNADKRFPPEIRANACALLGQVGRKGAVADGDAERARELGRVKEATREVLEAAAEGEKGMYGGAAKRVLETWG
jgi:hypothetical protein